jgi:hypothetical protein
VVGAIIGGFLALFGLFILWVGVRARGSSVAIGSQGITINLPRAKADIAWSEIAAVGISVLWSRPPVSRRADLVEPKGLRTKVVVRIRLAPVIPNFANRPDLAGLHTEDEPIPFTHKINLMPGLMATEDRVPQADEAAAILQHFSGGRFVGIEYRETPVGRYT